MLAPIRVTFGSGESQIELVRLDWDVWKFRTPSLRELHGRSFRLVSIDAQKMFLEGNEVVAKIDVNLSGPSISVSYQQEDGYVGLMTAISGEIEYGAQFVTRIEWNPEHKMADYEMFRVDETRWLIIDRPRPPAGGSASRRTYESTIEGGVITVRTGRATVRVDVARGVVNENGTETNIAVLSDEMNGFLMTRADANADPTLGRFQKIGPENWQWTNADGRFFMRETARNETLITLQSEFVWTEGEMRPWQGQMTFDIGNARWTFSAVNGAVISNNLARPRRRSEAWRRGCRITTRSSLTEENAPRDVPTQPKQGGAADIAEMTRYAAETVEYENAKKTGTPWITSRAVYRTAVTLPPHAEWVEIWASDECSIGIGGETHLVNPSLRARVAPENLSRLLLTLDAAGPSCPTIYLRTSLMHTDDRHVIHPDVEAHKKIVAMKPGALRGAIGAGLPSEMTHAQADALQEGLQNLTRTVQYAYNETEHGVRRDRGVHAPNLKHPHFSMRLDGEGVAFSALAAHEVRTFIEGAELRRPQAGQGFFSDLWNDIKSAGEVIVHTAEAVAHDVFETLETVGEDIIETTDAIAEHVVSGDLSKLPGDIIHGGETIAGDFSKGVLKVGQDVLEGASRIVVITLRSVGRAVQYVLDHTGILGEALGALLDWAGAKLGEFVGWLLDNVGWGDVLRTHDAICDAFTGMADTAIGALETAQNASSTFFASLADGVDRNIDVAIDRLGVGDQPIPPGGHTQAVELVQWMVGHLFPSPGIASPISTPWSGASPAPADTMLSPFREALGPRGEKVEEALGPAIDQLFAVITDFERAPAHLMAAVLEALRSVADFGVALVGGLVDAMLELTKAAIRLFEEILFEEWTVPFLSEFYTSLTHGRKLSLMSFVSLLIAVPATIIGKVTSGAAPFARPAAQEELPPMSKAAHDWGLTYGAMHIIHGVLADINTVAGVVSAADIDIEIGSSGAAEAPGLSPGFIILRVADVAVGFLEQWSGNPIPPSPDEEYSLPFPDERDDIFLAPNYWSHVVWYYQWGGFGIDVVSSVFLTLMEADIAPKAGETQKQFNNRRDGHLSTFDDVMGAFNTARGIGHVSLMAVLAAVDGRKVAVLDEYERTHGAIVSRPETDGEGLQENFRTALDLEACAQAVAAREGVTHVKRHKVGQIGSEYITADYYPGWLQDLKQHKSWADAGHLPQKTFGNVMDCFPEIGQFGAMPSVVEASEGWSLVGTLTFDMLGHWGEGITVIVRTHQRALY